jgi:ligand-binding sensor domain-containing protein
MTTPPSPKAAAPLQTWAAKNRTNLLYGGAIVAALVLGSILGATAPPPAWKGVGTQVGHPLAVLVDPANAQTIYIGTEQGQVRVSTNSGSSWADDATGLPSNAPVSALLKSPDGVYFFAGTSAGVYAFNSATKTWAASSNGLPNGDGIDTLVFNAADHKTVLAGTEQNGVYRSTDGGKSWASSSNGLPNRADVYGLTGQSDFKTLYAAVIGAGVYRSTDGGTSWVASNTGLPTKIDVFTVTLRPDDQSSVLHLFAGTDQGIFRSDDGAAHWVSSSQGLGTTRAISLAVDPQTSLVMVAGTDNGVYESNNGGLAWLTLAKGIPNGQHVGVVAISHPSNANEMAFAAGDQLYVYPGSTSSTSATLSRIFILGALIGTVLWLTTRQRRTIQAMTPKVPNRIPPRNPRPTVRPADTSHIRGGPPPAAPPT